MERRFSIVLTVYNAEKYLPKCLESVKNQTYSNWELILVNDGSTDKSDEISKMFKELINSDKSSRCVLYLEHKNQGAVYSRECGICRATGDYVLFIDADDYYDIDLIEKVNDAIDKSDADIIQFGYKFVDEDGTRTTDCGLTKKGGNDNGELIVDHDSNSFAYKALSICYSLWSRAFRRSLFDKEAGYYKDYYDVNMTNDLLALSRPLSLAKVYCFTNYYLYNYRILKTSLCHDVSAMKICSYFKSIGWTEKCLRDANGMTKEHFEFFSKRMVNIVFDEYRMMIYSYNIRTIKRIYSASRLVNGIEDYLNIPYKNERNWYKRLFLNSFIHRRVLLPKMLFWYTRIKNR